MRQPRVGTHQSSSCLQVLCTPYMSYCHQILRVAMASMAVNALHALIPTLPQFARRALASLPPLVHARSCTYLGVVIPSTCSSLHVPAAGWLGSRLPLVDECWDELHTK